MRQLQEPIVAVWKSSRVGTVSTSAVLSFAKNHIIHRKVVFGMKKTAAVVMSLVALGAVSGCGSKGHHSAVSQANQARRHVQNSNPNNNYGKGYPRDTADALMGRMAGCSNPHYNVNHSGWAASAREVDVCTYNDGSQVVIAEFADNNAAMDAVGKSNYDRQYAHKLHINKRFVFGDDGPRWASVSYPRVRK